MTRSSKAGPPPRIFDRELLRQRQRRVAGRFEDHDFLHRLIAADIVDRLETVTRSFSTALVSGSGGHLLRQSLTPKAGVGRLFDTSLAPMSPKQPPHVLFDEEDFPVAPGSLDLAVSMMSLHMVNDLPGALIKIRQALKPDGLFIAALPGEETLHELRTSLYTAESTLTGGVSPRLIPFAAIRDLGGLLQRAGFALPVADLITEKVTYRNPYTLLQDLRYMGESNILVNQNRRALRRDVLNETMKEYATRFASRDGAGVSATFDIVVLTAWAPHASQQKPLRPGSGKVPLADAVKRSIS